MISIWHLLWVVPLSVIIGSLTTFFTMALAVVAKDGKE